MIIGQLAINTSNNYSIIIESQEKTKAAYLIKLEPSMVFEMMCDLRLLLQEPVYAKCNLSALGRFFANLITVRDERRVEGIAGPI